MEKQTSKQTTQHTHTYLKHVEFIYSFIFWNFILGCLLGFPAGSVVKRACNLEELLSSSPGSGDPLEEAAAHSSTGLLENSMDGELMTSAP